MANDDALTLAQRFAPILFFHPDERFFPSDAKRYIERCALWKAEFPFDAKDAWGGKGAPYPRKPMIEHEGIVASAADPVLPGHTYLGGLPFLVDHQGEEHFFELAGWKDSSAVEQLSVNRYSNRDELQARYDPRGDALLSGSQFWFHAELFDLDRLNFLTGLQPSAPTVDLKALLKALLPTNPALLCYYFFFPAHEESLAAPCDTVETGIEFGCFAGEWACLAILLGRPDAAADYAAKWIGVTGRRNIGTPQAFDNEGRSGMIVTRWRHKTDPHAQLLPDTIEDHPMLWVARGTHSLYLQPRTAKNIINPYPPDLYPQVCGTFDGPDALSHGGSSYEAQDSSAATAKIVGGFAVGGALGMIGGMIAAALEGNLGSGLDVVGAAAADQPAPDVTATPDRVGMLAYPPGTEGALQDIPANLAPWKVAPDLVIDGKQYDFIVDRLSQVWWPADEGNTGFRGRWGPQVARDGVHRRSGMRFPDYWRMFLEALAMAPPS